MSGMASNHSGVEEDLFRGDEDDGDFVAGGDEAEGGDASRHVLFDRVVSCLEEALMDLKDETEAFCRANCEVFDDSGEEKLSYMSLFNDYTARIEGHLERALLEKVPELNGLEEVEELLKEKPDEVTGDVFDVLVSLGDYGEFKSLMLAYKEQVRAEAEAEAARAKRGASSASSAASGHRSSSGPASRASEDRKYDDDDEVGDEEVSHHHSHHGHGHAHGHMGLVLPPPSPIIPPEAMAASLESFAGGKGNNKKGASSSAGAAGSGFVLAPTVIHLGSGAGSSSSARR